MPIDKIPGAIAVTGDSIPLYRLLVLRGRLRLEIKGFGFKGKSTSAVIKQEFGIRGRTKKDVLAKFEAYIQERYPNAAP